MIRLSLETVRKLKETCVYFKFLVLYLESQYLTKEFPTNFRVPVDISLSQYLPVHPKGQMQWYEVTLDATHKEPCLQTLFTQLTDWLHTEPVHNGGHTQVNESLLVALQWPPFWHTLYPQAVPSQSPMLAPLKAPLSVNSNSRSLSVISRRPPVKLTGSPSVASVETKLRVDTPPTKTSVATSSVAMPSVTFSLTSLLSRLRKPRLPVRPALTVSQVLPLKSTCSEDCRMWVPSPRLYRSWTNPDASERQKKSPVEKTIYE